MKNIFKIILALVFAGCSTEGLVAKLDGGTGLVRGSIGPTTQPDALNQLDSLSQSDSLVLNDTKVNPDTIINSADTTPVDSLVAIDTTPSKDTLVAEDTFTATDIIIATDTILPVDSTMDGGVFINNACTGYLPGAVYDPKKTYIDVSQGVCSNFTRSPSISCNKYTQEDCKNEVFKLCGFCQVYCGVCVP